MNTLLILAFHFTDYLLGAGQSYRPTVQHTQDCPIFLIQLNHVHK